MSAAGREVGVVPGADLVNGDQQVPITVLYDDGSSSTTTVGVTDWAAASAKFGEDLAATADHRYRNTGVGDDKDVHVWHVALPVTAGKTVTALASPNQQNVKLFAISGRN